MSVTPSAVRFVFSALGLATLAFAGGSPHRPASAATPAGFNRELLFAPGRSGASFLARTPRGVISVSPSGAAISIGARTTGIRFPGANPRAAAEPIAPRAKFNFYLGNDPAAWRTAVPAAASVAFDNIYPGVDVLYHGARGSLEYDLRVAPGADPARLRIAIDAGGPLTVTSAGDVTAGGAVVQKRPIAYQFVHGQRRDVPARAVLAGGNVIAFSLGAYDRSQPLILDPILVFATYLGGNQYTGLESVAVDSSGNAYVAGWSDSTDFQTMPPGSTTFRGGYDDIVVSKFDPTGKLLLSSYIGGSSEDEAYAIALDPSGNLLLTGETESTNFPVYPAKVFQGTGTNLSEDTAFAVKLDANLNILAATYIGGHLNDNSCTADYNEGYGIASDPSGNVYVTGQTCVTDFPLQNALQSTIQGTYACFITELNPSLSAAIYSTYLGGTVSDYCNAIAVDSSGAAYVTGATFSSNLATKGAFQSQYGGGSSTGDAFIAKINPNGTGIAYYTYLGGSSDDSGEAILVDSSGDAYLTGFTDSRNFPVMNALQATYAGGTGALPSGAYAGDVFVAELNPTGSALLYSTYFGSSGDESGYNIVLDASGNIYVAGSTNSSNLKTTPDAVQPTFGGMQDAFVLEMSPGGASVKYLSYLGGSQIESGRGLAVGGSGNIYATGNTASADFHIVNAAITSLTGNEAGFVAMIGSPEQPSPVVNSVTNGASFSTAVSPGQLATVFGQTLLTTKNTASILPLPVSLAGISVTVNSIAAPLLYADSQQINFQIPWETAAGQATVVVTHGSATSLPVNFTVSAAAPGIFTYGNNRAVAQNYPSGELNGPSAPVSAGNVITVYLTGIGPVTIPGSDGVATPATAISKATLPFTAAMGGQLAPVSFLGLTPLFVGLAQANISVPTGLASGDYPLVISVGGVASNAPLVAVK